MEDLDFKSIVFAPHKLKEAREKRYPGVSARRVAMRFLNMSYGSLRAYEKGINAPNPTTLLQLCFAYQVTDLRELADIAVVE